MKFKINFSLKTIWIIWLALALITTSVFTLIDLAVYAPELPVKLVSGSQHTWRVWRPFATENTQFEMAYHRDTKGDLRLNVLGDKNNGIVGEPVVIRLTVNGQSCETLQDDVNSWNNWVFRPMKSIQAACKLPEQSGINEWTAQITQVSPSLADENTRLGMISPAGTIKNRADNIYGVMAEILFWGELIWLPFFLFMSLPLLMDGFNRLIRKYDLDTKLKRSYQKIAWNLRNKW